MTLAFLAVVVQRNRIRAHWWAHKLKQTDDLTEQAYYIACLASAEDDAVGALQSLIEDPRTELQLLAIPGSQGMTPSLRHERILSPLLHSDDEEVAAAVATAIAFTHWNPGDKLLLNAARSKGESLAVAAAVGLARIDSDAATAALCDMARNHASPKARAQAVESLGSHVQLHPTSQPAKSPNADPLTVLVRALNDSATFTGKLAIEREVESISAAVTAQKGLRVAASQPSAARTVAEITAAILSTLTGHDIPPTPVDSAEEPAFIEKCRGWIADRKTLIPTSLPTSQPN